MKNKDLFRALSGQLVGFVIICPDMDNKKFEVVIQFVGEIFAGLVSLCVWNYFF